VSPSLPLAACRHHDPRLFDDQIDGETREQRHQRYTAAADPIDGSAQRDQQGWLPVTLLATVRDGPTRRRRPARSALSWTAAVQREPIGDQLFHHRGQAHLLTAMRDR
jgi:hypothetical protein